jgi:hypothetical protein
MLSVGSPQARPARASDTITATDFTRYMAFSSIGARTAGAAVGANRRANFRNCLEGYTQLSPYVRRPVTMPNSGSRMVPQRTENTRLAVRFGRDTPYSLPNRPLRTAATLRSLTIIPTLDRTRVALAGLLLTVCIRWS